MQTTRGIPKSDAEYDEEALDRARKLRSLQQSGMRHTHSDLHQGDILVDEGYIAGLIDWQVAGWYPEFGDILQHYGLRRRTFGVISL
ncbi:Aminoglycoside phosphotransferase protein [Rutstroemia sp. NJR-2017a BVV2]|nr:Aminoglycoside phosphotransferase protein [Rutstroemia sp. NJR-2017a BVV2]